MNESTFESPKTARKLIQHLFRAFFRYFWPAFDKNNRLLSARVRIVCAVSGLTALVGFLSGLVSYPITVEYANQALAIWALAAPLLGTIAPFIVHRYKRVDLGGLALLGFLYPHLTFLTLMYDGLLWPVAAYLTVLPSLTYLTLGNRAGVLATCLSILVLTFAGMHTVPSWVATTLIVTTFGLSLALFVFHREMEATTEHLQQLERRAQASNQEKSDFLANMSHEIRTPLNGVTGTLQLLKDSSLNEEQAELVHLSLISGETLLRLVNNVLDYSKIEANGLQLEMVDVRPRDFITPVTSGLSAKAGERGLSLVSYIDPLLPPYLVGDPVRLTQIVSNLVSNAIKFSENGTIKVRVQCAGDFVRVEVEDQGIGISVDAQARVFKKFEQASASTSRLFGGTGLGLAISKELVELHGGEIGVTSGLGKGSIFWFTFPLLAGKPPEVAPQTANAEKSRFAGYRVLVADDNKTNRLIASRFLQAFGIDPDLAVDGRQAIERARVQSFDLILMDLQMPVLDGLEATKTLKASFGPNQTTPIVALSASVGDAQKKACRRAGMVDFLEKPFRKEEFHDLLCRHLATKDTDPNS